MSVCYHFNLNFRTMWDKKTGTPRDCLFDGVLEFFKKNGYIRL